MSDFETSAYQFLPTTHFPLIQVSGKTVLCEKVIGIGSIVSLTGDDFKYLDDFWKIVASKVGISLEGEYSETAQYKGTSINPEEESVSTRE